MNFLLDKNHKYTLFEQAYIQLLTALHMGKVSSGDRLPSVRQVALRNNINLKTVHAIYQRLQTEGYISLHTGSGAYVSDIDQANLEQAFCLSIFRMIKSNLSEAIGLRVSPREYTKLVQSFISRRRLKSARVAVVECNDEQIGLFAHEITERTGITVLPLLLAELESPDRRVRGILEKVDYIATTHFHFKQVQFLTAKYRKGMLQLRLNPAFVPAILGAAQRGTVLLMVSNADYFPAFRQSLLQIGTPPGLVNRISVADHFNLDRARALAAAAQTFYVSPISTSELRELLPVRANQLKFDSTLASESLEMLEAIVLFSSGQVSN